MQNSFIIANYRIMEYTDSDCDILNYIAKKESILTLVLSRCLFIFSYELSSVISMSKQTQLPTKTVQRIIKEATNMMVSQELAEYEAEVVRLILVKRAKRLKAFAEQTKKKILKKEMAKIFDAVENPY